MKKYFLIFLLFLFFLPFNVFASYNVNSQYNINIPDYDDYFKNFTCGNENVKDFLHNFIDNYNYSPHLLIFPFTDFSNGNYEGNTIMFLAYSLNNTQYNRFSFYAVQNGSVKTGYLFNASNTFSTSKQYILNLDTCDSNISTSSSWLAFKNFLSSVSSSSDVIDNVGSYKSAGSSNTTFTRSGNSLNFSNNDSFDIESLTGNDFYKSFVWPYWSDRSLQYKATLDSVYSSSTAYFKKLHIVNNGNTYEYLDYDIPTFYDVKDNFVHNTYSKTFSNLDTFYINTTTFNNFAFSFDFSLDVANSIFNNITATDFANNLDFNYYCSGRVNHNDYYTYESFPCSLTSSYIISNLYNIKFNFNNVSYDSNNVNISNYDKLFITIKSLYIDNTLPQYGLNLHTSSNGNNLHTKFLGIIYDNFLNLLSSTNILLSSNNDVINSSVSIFDYKKYGLLSYSYDSFDKFSHINGESILVDVANNTNNSLDNILTFNVSNNIDDKVLISQKLGYDTSIDNLQLIFYPGLVISINTSSSDDLSYINSSGNIVSNDFYKPVANDDKYNVDDSFNSIDDYINSLSTDIYNFSLVIQSFYDNLPVFFQTFLFIIFLIACVYFTYLLIKK